MTWIPETIIRALCWTLLHSLWQGLILAVVAGIVMVLTKRAKSSTRYAALSVLILAFLAVSGFTFFREMRVPVSHGSTAMLITQPAETALAPLIHADNAVPSANAGTLSALVQQLVQYFNAHASVVVVIWFILFLARFVNLLSGLVYAQRIRHYQTSLAADEWQQRLATLLHRLRIRRPVILLESALIKVPVVVGWLKPAVLVPIGMLAQIPAEQVESILLHELAHISRRDYLFNFVQHVVDTMFFFNPALLWVSSLIRQERENCCDDVAIRETRSRRRLVQALVSFHEYQQSSGSFALGFAGGRNHLVKRVERIVHKRNHSLNAGERALLTGGLMLLCGAFITVNGPNRAVRAVAAKQAVVAEAASRAIAANPGISATEGTAATKGNTAAAGNAANPVSVANPGGTVNPGTAASRETAANPAGTGEGRLLDMMTRSRISIRTAMSISPIISVGRDTTPPAGTMTMADVDKIIRARDHGVTTGFLTDLKDAGYTVTIEDAIKLKDHGVGVGFLRDLSKEGFGHVSLEEAVRLVDHGVSINFIRRIRDLGFPDLTLDQAVTLIDHGVSPNFIEKWKAKTGSKLVLQDYIKLQDAGIQPS